MRSLLAVLSAMVLLPAGEARADDLYVTVAGSGIACTEASPCSLQTAVAQVKSGEFIYVGEGTYDALPPINMTQGSMFGRVTTQDRPLLRFAGDGLTATGRVGGIDIEAAGNGLTLKGFAEGTSMLVRTTAEGAAACTIDYADLKQSACLAPNGVGVYRTAAVRAGDPADIVWVTALGKMAGIRAAAGDSPDSRIDRTIARASSGTDIERLAPGAGESAALLTITGSNYATGPSSPDQQTAAPAFLGDGYHQAAGSPTIDALPATAEIAYDIDGDDRREVPVDIGADEFYAPSASTAPATGVTTTSAVLEGAFDPHGIHGTAAFEWGTSPAFGQIAGSAPIRRELSRSHTLTGLAPATTYHDRAVLTAGGTPYPGAPVSFTTLAVPTPDPTPTVTVSPTATATTPPDVDDPKVRIKLRGKLVIGRTVRVRVEAEDPSGIARVTLQVGKGPVVEKRRLRLKIKRRRTRITATAQDTTGRVTRVTRVIKSRS